MASAGPVASSASWLANRLADAPAPRPRRKATIDNAIAPAIHNAISAPSTARVGAESVTRSQAASRLLSLLPPAGEGWMRVFFLLAFAGEGGRGSSSIYNDPA